MSWRQELLALIESQSPEISQLQEQVRVLVSQGELEAGAASSHRETESKDLSATRASSSSRISGELEAGVASRHRETES